MRAAPAPSGELHVGNVRTFLFNWLYARHLGGTFILRIEDTDKARFTEEAYQAALEDLRWLGLDWDEGPEAGGDFGPYRQSQRADRHRAGVDLLLSSKSAYKCYCTPERLDSVRKQMQAEGRRPMYDLHCYHLDDEEKARLEAQGVAHTVRFHIPDGKTTFDDLVVGTVTVDNSDVDDFVIMRSDGSPLYNLTVVMDDADMKISHVVRGDDHLSNTPKQILLHQALGHPLPLFAHVPQVLGQDRKPLAKRHGSTSVGEFRNAGYLPEALLNHLALLGWGTADDTILSKQELIARFDIGDVHASPAMFDFQKLDWMNGEYIRMLGDSEVADALEPWLARNGLVGVPASDKEKSILRRVAPLIKTRVKRFDEAAAYSAPLFGRQEVDGQAWEKWMTADHVPLLLERAVEALSGLDRWDASTIEEKLRSIQESMDLKRKTAFIPFFVAITGRAVGLPIFDLMEVVGPEESIGRIRSALERANGRAS